MVIDDNIVQTTSELVKKAYSDGIKDGIKFATEQIVLTKIDTRKLSDDEFIFVQGKGLTQENAQIIHSTLKNILGATSLANKIIIFTTDDVTFKIECLNKMLENLTREKEVVNKTESNVNPVELHKFRVIEDSKHE